MREPLFVNYHTDDYAEIAKGLVEDLKTLRLDHRIVVVPSKGSWDKNARMKPWVVLKTMSQNPGRPVVWLDADCRIRRRPDLFWTLDCDVAVHRTTYNGGRTFDHITGTVYFSGSASSREFVPKWAAFAAADREGHGDQHHFNKLVDLRPPARLEWLPVSYNFIFDTHRKNHPDVQPVIEHFQASRGRR